jgi:hypothetical protein
MSTININISKVDLGLDQVDNTSDLNKPISTATQTALDNIDLQSVTDNGNTTDNDVQFSDGVGILLNNTSRLREGTIDSGAGGGIAQICAVGYELKWEAGSQYVMDGNGLLIREVNHKFTSIPDANNDNTQGFYVGSRWILDDGSLYICTDSTTSNAVWVLQTIDSVPTNGSTKAVESNGVFDALNNKVDKVAGSRLITSAESTVIGNTSGTNTGDQNLSGLAPLASPTFTGTVVLPTDTSIGTVSSTELGYLDGVASSVQNQLNAKVNLNTLITEGSGLRIFYDAKGLVLSSENCNVQTVTSSATVTAVSTNDLVNITAQAVGLTLANPTGTFYNGQIISFRIKDNATPRTIAYGSKFKAFGSALPTTTVASKITLLSAMYNSVADTFETVNSQEQ